eukprot:3381676-Amphidinium_carterae.4
MHVLTDVSVLGIDFVMNVSRTARKKKHDANHDTCIAKRRFCGAMHTSLALSCSGQERALPTNTKQFSSVAFHAQALFQEIDEDDSGAISIEEFERYLTNDEV